MAARINRMHSEQVRAKIQAAVLVQRLEGHAMGENEMTSTQITAAIALLDRSVPKLQQIQHVGGGTDGEIAHSLKVEFVNSGVGSVS
jgi:hypothetical protein